MAKEAHIKPIIGTTAPNVGTPQTHFNREPFDDFITDKGYSVEIERAVKCPCRVVSGGNAQSNCSNCAGTGWFYIDKRSTIVTCVSMSNTVKNAVWSEQNMGTVSISTRPQDRIGWMDRVTLVEEEMQFSQSLKMWRNTNEGEIYFFVTYKPITIFEVYLFKSTNEKLVYVPNIDIAINFNKINVDFNKYKDYFTDDDDFVGVAIVYTHNPSYLIVDSTRNVIRQIDEATDQKTNLPLHYVGRLAHYVIDNPDFSGQSIFDNTAYDRTAINYDYGSDANSFYPVQPTVKNKEIIYFTDKSSVEIKLTTQLKQMLGDMVHVDTFITVNNRAVLVDVPYGLDAPTLDTATKIIVNLTGNSSGFLLIY